MEIRYNTSEDSRTGFRYINKVKIIRENHDLSTLNLSLAGIIFDERGSKYVFNPKSDTEVVDISARNIQSDSANVIMKISGLDSIIIPRTTWILDNTL